MHQSQNFSNSSSRGGFQNRRDQGDTGDFDRRGDRGSQRGGKL